MMACTSPARTAGEVDWEVDLDIHHEAHFRTVDANLDCTACRL